MKRITISMAAVSALVVQGAKLEDVSPNDDDTADIMVDDEVFATLQELTGGAMDVPSVSSVIIHLSWRSM